MEEADARLQEVVACLLNEHGGNHEPALRQTFACLHNSGLYEAQSPAEEEQREQQVLAVFRSFPFRAGAPVDTGVGSRVEETQAAPTSYGGGYVSHGSSSSSGPGSNAGGAVAGYVLGTAGSNGVVAVGTGSSNSSSVSSGNTKEPEEAGEIAAAGGDPENVGEDPAANPPEALPPLYAEETHETGGASFAGPEFSYQEERSHPPRLPGSEDPEGIEDGGFLGSSSASTPIQMSQSTSGVRVTSDGQGASSSAAPSNGAEESKGGGEEGEEWEDSATADQAGALGGGSCNYPETGEAEKGGASVGQGGVRPEAPHGAIVEENATRRPGDSNGDHTGGMGRSSARTTQGVRDAGYNGKLGSNEAGPDIGPESTNSEEGRQERISTARFPHNGAAPSGSRVEPRHCPDGFGMSRINEASWQRVPRPTELKSLGAAPAKGHFGAAPANPYPPRGSVPSAVGLGVSYAGGAGKPVAESHLKTGGQPLVHSNRAASPNGMSDELLATLKALKIRRRHRFVVMRIDGTQVVAETVASPKEGPAELRTALPYSDCRYGVYDQEIVTSDGRKANKLFFITWLPHNATPHNKMAYSHGKATVRQRLEGFYDVAASSFADIEVALGLVDEEDEESDIEF